MNPLLKIVFIELGIAAGVAAGVKALLRAREDGRRSGRREAIAELDEERALRVAADRRLEMQDILRLRRRKEACVNRYKKDFK